MLETFSAASTKAKVLNVLFLLFNLMAWIACCVAFGAELIHLSYKPPGAKSPTELSFRWNRFTNGPDVTYGYADDICQRSYCDECKKGGRGLIGTMVLAFLLLSATLVLSLVRVLGGSIARLEPTRKALGVELVLTMLSAFFFFLAICVFGATCFKSTGDVKYASRHGTGFAYIIVCFLLLLLNLVLAFVIRGDASTHLGSAGGAGAYASESYDPNTTSYNPPATYQYHADPAQTAVYAQQYNTEPAPAAI